MRHPFWGLFLLGAGFPAGAAADWQVPAPQPLPPVAAAPLAVDFVRPNPYDVWQLYGVDRFGYFRPRVVPTSTGYRYLFNGSPFPWWMNYSREIDPILPQPANVQGGAPQLVPVIPAQPLPVHP